MYMNNILSIKSPFLLPKMFQLLFQSVHISITGEILVFSVVRYLWIIQIMKMILWTNFLNSYASQI